MKFDEFVNNAAAMANGQRVGRVSELRALFFEDIGYEPSLARNSANTYKADDGDCVLTIKWAGGEDMYVECNYKGIVFFQQHTTKECVPGCMLELLTALTQEMLKY